MDLTGFFAGIAGSLCIVYVSLCIENNVQRLASRERNQNCGDLLYEPDNLHSPFD